MTGRLTAKRERARLEAELASAEARLEAVARMVVALRREVRSARPTRVPELTRQLHELEAVAAGEAEPPPVPEPVA